MPSTLRRSRRRELVLTTSFTRAIQDKVRLESPRIDGKECRALFTDRTNGHTRNAHFASTFETSSLPALTSRPSMVLALYHSPNPLLPTHPIHRLPPELLVQIFSMGSVDDAMFPILMSHVCHSWRAIASHALALWRRVSFTPNSNLHMWKERIRRARLCTLDVSLMSHPNSRTLYDIDNVALQMHLLAPHFSALRSLNIQFNSYAPYLWNAALGPFCRPASYLWDHRSPNPGDQSFISDVHVPKLESLALRYPKNDDLKEFTLFGGFAPKLTRVTLEGVRLTWLPELFGNLSFLDYTHHGFSHGEEAVDEILSMLQVSSRIRELRLCFCRKTTSYQAMHLRRLMVGDVDVALPFLESLSLRVDNEDLDIPSELICIFSRLSMPRVKNLYLRDVMLSTVSPRSFGALTTFMDTVCRNTSVRTLVVEGRWVEPSLLSVLAAQLPLLNFIQVRDSLGKGVRNTEDKYST